MPLFSSPSTFSRASGTLSPESRDKGRLKAVFALWTAFCFFGIYLLSFTPHDHGCETEESACAASETIDCPLCHVANHQSVSTPDPLALAEAAQPLMQQGVTAAPLEEPPSPRYLLPLLRAPPLA
jgi:hypothetical protein